MSEHAERVSVAPPERLVERSPRDEGLGPVVPVFVVSVIAAYAVLAAAIYVAITALFL
jgi:hypothetical protein